MFIFWNVLAVIFIIFAWVQLNDPDPLIWFSLYLVNALTLLGAANHKISLTMSSIMCLTCLFLAYIHWPPTFKGFEGDMNQHPHIELAREAAGLLLVSLSQVGVMIYGFKKGEES